MLGPLVTSLPLQDYLRSPQLATYLARSFALTPSSPGLPSVTFADTSVGNIVNGSLWTLRYEIMMYAMVLLLGVLRAAAAVDGPRPGRGGHRRGGLREGADAVWRSRRDGMAAGVLCVGHGDAFPARQAAVPLTLYRSLAFAALAVFIGMHRFIMLFPLAGAYLAIGFASRYDRALDYSRYTGDLSYGLYIYGWPAEDLIMWLSGGQAAWWQVFLGSLAVALPLAYLSWHFDRKAGAALGPPPRAAASCRIASIDSASHAALPSRDRAAVREIPRWLTTC